MSEMIRDRGENIPNEDVNFATTEIKENYGYLCKDIIEEFGKFDEKPLDSNGKPIAAKLFLLL